MSSYGFIKLCYGVVGSYMDTSKMTVDEVVEEFLKHEGVSSAEEYYDKISQNTYEKLKQEVLTNSKHRDIIDEVNNKPVVQISDTAISKVPKLKIYGLTDEQNTFIQEQHRELLQYARDNNESKEIAFVFRKDFSDRCLFLGSDSEINFGAGLSGKGDNLFVMHNHPRNTSFSKTDIDEFINNNNIKTLSIVKNNGSVEIITKGNGYSQTKAFLYKERYKRKIAPNKTTTEYDKMVIKFLSYCEKEDMIRWIK